mmetsp:Transcript_7888/g.8456  ORF Transcript_7888/g.8456 Transcript_7888/m.8456 type:complete len:89 (+) Transcript_7888:90-356(+)
MQWNGRRKRKKKENQTISDLKTWHHGFTRYIVIVGGMNHRSSDICESNVFFDSLTSTNYCDKCKQETVRHAYQYQYFGHTPGPTIRNE